MRELTMQQWTGERLLPWDQTLWPGEAVEEGFADPEDGYAAIRDLKIRALSAGISALFRK